MLGLKTKVENNELEIIITTEKDFNDSTNSELFLHELITLIKKYNAR